jgi:hypothetical protein
MLLFEKVLKRTFPEGWFGELWFCVFLVVAVSWFAVGISTLATRLRTRVTSACFISLHFTVLFSMLFFLQVFPVRASYFSFRVLFFGCAVS